MVSSSSSSSRTWNLFRSTLLNSCCLVVSLSDRVVSYLRHWKLSPVQFLLSLRFILAIRRWWSEATSAPCITQTSWGDLLNFLHMHTWSIWYSVERSGYTQVALCILLCGKTLPPILGYSKHNRRRIFRHCDSSLPTRAVQ